MDDARKPKGIVAIVTEVMMTPMALVRSLTFLPRSPHTTGSRPAIKQMREHMVKGACPFNVGPKILFNT